MKALLVAAFVAIAACSHVFAQDDDPAAAQDETSPLQEVVQEAVQRVLSAQSDEGEETSGLSTGQRAALQVLLQALQQSQSDNAIMGIITTDSVEIRESPPHGPFNLFIGDEILTSVGQGTIVEIVDERNVGTFEGSQVWYSIRPLHATTMDREWWINAGMESIGGQTPAVSVAAQVAKQR